MINFKNRFINVSENTRPNENIIKVHKIILHQCPLKEKSAIFNRNYINNLQYQDNIFHSYHYIVGLDGKIINIIPEEETALHTNILAIDNYSIGIGICNSDRYENKVSEKEINSLKFLCDYLVKKYNLDKKFDIIRCYDIINKRSPYFFIDIPYFFQDFKYSI